MHHVIKKTCFRQRLYTGHGAAEKVQIISFQEAQWTIFQILTFEDGEGKRILTFAFIRFSTATLKVRIAARTRRETGNITWR